MPYLRQDYPQVGVPWARPNSDFTRRMETLLVTLCKAMTVSQVAQLPSVSGGRVWRTLDHYVRSDTCSGGLLDRHLGRSRRDRLTAWTQRRSTGKRGSVSDERSAMPPA